MGLKKRVYRELKFQKSVAAQVRKDLHDLRLPRDTIMYGRLEGRLPKKQLPINKLLGYQVGAADMEILNKSHKGVYTQLNIEFKATSRKKGLQRGHARASQCKRLILLRNLGHCSISVDCGQGDVEAAAVQVAGLISAYRTGPLKKLDPFKI